MAYVIDKLKTAFSHTRKVYSGSYPLYRMICFFGVVSAVLSFAGDAWPASFVEATDGAVYQNIFGGMQLVGCLLVLVGMYFHKEDEPSLQKVSTALYLERTGCSLLIPVVASYTWGVIQMNMGPPTTWATLTLVAAGLYFVIRFIEIGRVLKGLRANAPKAEELKGE
ncbi:hypothetical protein TIN4_33 [Tsukamurella phage TIN4]|uniref:Uncharacterized protein n=2 Tax=Tinduovirus TIN3 TaxID=1982571 RepID=A0A0K0N5Z9_9CAUD|nr:hypothetical protein AVT54_gp092 [Tsukamurella phage TIN3]YP_009604163.1 hypothetical protein FDH87_gp092 [Tsukamurella phage TIN4]AKJ71830.1 hypothetical protein TIN3_33 [Tsukamurella phage TIN3]AKJ71939.1 hypothetical protein TIN4_33 [Tsukamurella phage TIN4]